MGVALPKDDWTPAKIKDHQAWRKKMYAPSVKQIQITHLQAEIIPPPPVEMTRQVVVTVNFGFPMLPVNEYKAFKLKAIQKACCVAASISVSEMMCDDRSYRLTKPRHIAMMLCRMLGGPGSTNSVIGKIFGGRDHTTVLHATTKLSEVRAAVERRVPAGSPLNEYVAAAFDAYDQIIGPRYEKLAEAQRQRIAQRNREGGRWNKRGSN